MSALPPDVIAVIRNTVKDALREHVAPRRLYYSTAEAMNMTTFDCPKRFKEFMDSMGFRKGPGRDKWIACDIDNYRKKLEQSA